MATEELIAGCIRGDRKAQYGMYRALYPMLMSICSRYERDRQNAMARLNEGFLKILQRLHERREGVPFEAWVRRVMINTIIDEFRRDRSRREHEVPMDNGTINDHELINDYLHTMEAEALEVLLQKLPPMSRNVFNLFAVDGYGHGEIAEMLGMSIGTSKWHVSHARKILQEAIGRLAITKVTIR